MASQRREQWLARVPSVQAGDPWYAFRSVSHRWVDQNLHSRENVMRSCLRTLLGHVFIKMRPDFLRNPKTRRCLELDAYCAELHLGVEFHGIQHYEFPNPFHSTREQFQRQCDRDELKGTLCKNHGVRLIVVPHHVQREDMEQYLRTQLVHLGLLGEPSNVLCVVDTAATANAESEADLTQALLVSLHINDA